MEKTTVYLLFSLFVQFSAVEIRWVFPHTKLRIRWLQWLENKGGVPVVVGELLPFFNWQSSISRQIRHLFNVRVHERVLNGAINYARSTYSILLKGLQGYRPTDRNHRNNPEDILIWGRQNTYMVISNAAAWGELMRTAADGLNENPKCNFRAHKWLTFLLNNFLN